MQINYVTPTRHQRPRRNPVIGRWDVFVVDATASLPDALDYCRCVRRSRRDAPILLIVTADVLTQALAGWPVDDLVLDTSSPAELSARIALVHARRNGSARSQLRLGPLTLDKDEWTFSDGSTTVALSRVEFAIMQTFLTLPNVVLTREELRVHAWGDRPELTGRHIDVSICRLRRKLGPQAERIGTVRRVGYRFTGSAREGALSSVA